MEDKKLEKIKKYKASLPRRIWCRCYQRVMYIAEFMLPWRVPEQISGEGSLKKLAAFAKSKGFKSGLLVTDSVLFGLGMAQPIIDGFKAEGLKLTVFDKVVPNPTIQNIEEGLQLYKDNDCDVIIALGGGSSMDCAKGIGARVARPKKSIPQMKGVLKVMKKLPPLVAIPTTSGTGSEVTSFSVITDKKNGNIKYPLADYSLTPDVAIIDPQFTWSMPKSIVADTGLDVLTHAIEAYVSTMANDYTDGLALHAIEMVFTYLEKSYNGDRLAREKMHNASCIAGMAFTNAFLGLNHSMAHKLGGEYHIPHGRANAILLPYVIKYNATKPTKFASFPKYKEYVADERYAKIARRVGLCSAKAPTQEAVDSLISAIEDLMRATERPLSISACGISEAEFMSKVEELSYKAFEDQCTTANPVYPLVSEIEELYKAAFYGKEAKKA